MLRRLEQNRRGATKEPSRSARPGIDLELRHFEAVASREPKSTATQGDLCVVLETREQ